MVTVWIEKPKLGKADARDTSLKLSYQQGKILWHFTTGSERKSKNK